jgi:hypothetical protein
MDELISQAFKTTFHTILEDLNPDNFRFINESILRYLFIKSLPDDIDAEEEWRRVDLLLHDERGQYPIEFKHYFRRPLKRFDGRTHNYKGGPSKKNIREFIDSSKKLVQLEENLSIQKMGIDFKDRYFILVAGDRERDKTKFSDFYKEEYISILYENGIKSYLLVEEAKTIDDLHIFGWVLKMKKID